MLQIILVWGNWRFEKNRWIFIVDSSRGSRVLGTNAVTSFKEFIQMVYEDYGVDKNKYEVELSYMLPKKILVKLPVDTPPVFVGNTRQLQGFFEQFKSDTLRLCVSDKEVSSKSKLAQKREDGEDKHAQGRSSHKRAKIEVEFDGNTKLEGDDARSGDEEEENEDQYRFDCCDDPDGASSGDEDYCLYEKLREEEEKEEKEEKARVPNNKKKAERNDSKVDEDYRKMEMTSLDISVGQRYDNKEALEMRLKILSVAQKFDFNVDYSTPTLLIVRCWVEGCTWRVRATTVGDSPYFFIKVYVKEHSCSVTDRGARCRQATHEILGQMYKDFVGGIGSKVLPSHVADALNKRYGIKMEYWKAYRALKHARLLAMGSPESGYEQIPSYLYLIRRANPGTYTCLEVDAEDRFKYLFISFGASINGFQYMRKVVVVDGTYLRGKYKGTLLLATCQDGNFNIFPIAFAVVDTENDASWEWFFTQLSCVIPDDVSLSIISDRHKSISKAIKKVYPLASRGICTYHMYKNIITRFKGRQAFRLVKKAAHTYKISDFNSIFTAIQDVNPALHSYLLKADVKVWSRAHFPGNRYNILTSNIAESLNRVLSEARNLPISKLLDAIRSMLTRWFSARRREAGLMTTTLTRAAEKLLEPRVNDSRLLTVQEIDDDQVQVSSGTHVHVVNVRERKCTCRRFDLDKLPCVHAIASGEAKRMSRVSLTSPYYYKNYLSNAYAMCIMPSDVAQPIPEHVAAKLCLPPDVRNPPGRPKNSRYKSALEKGMEKKVPRKQHICSNCQKSGHNVRTCVM